MSLRIWRIFGSSLAVKTPASRRAMPRAARRRFCFTVRVADRLGEAGESGDLDAVARVGGAGDDYLALEDDAVVPFAHGDVGIAHRGALSKLSLTSLALTPDDAATIAFN